MAQQAREITAADLARRVPRRGAEDELDYLADTLNVVLARLEAAFAELKRFTADAAHELRTPLTALKSGLEVALRHPRTAEEHARTLQGSLEEVDRLVRLAEDLLLLSRATAGAGLARRRVELEPLVLEVFDLGLRLADGSGVSVRMGALEPAAVMGDPLALRRVVLILVENAVKYTPAGGVVELSLSRSGAVGSGGSARSAGSDGSGGSHGFGGSGGSGDPGGSGGPGGSRGSAGPASDADDAGEEIYVVVRDTGIGIDPADHARVFEPFVRLDDARSRETGGAGLGLAIARSIALAHGGAITLDSAPKAGSVFVVHFPAV
jgi:signal transduction histidine kinase